MNFYSHFLIKPHPSIKDTLFCGVGRGHGEFLSRFQPLTKMT